MTIQRNKDNEMIARCDDCKYLVTFEEKDNLLTVLKVLIADGWKARRAGKSWEHSCVDCVK